MVHIIIFVFPNLPLLHSPCSVNKNQDSDIKLFGMESRNVKILFNIHGDGRRYGFTGKCSFQY